MRKSLLILIALVSFIYPSLVSSSYALGEGNSKNQFYVGKSVFFGHYEQDNNEGNGDEPIEWIVLDKDDGKILLLSKYVLDCQVYNDSYVSTDWKSCSLRRWLNNTFFSNAFTKEEAQIVLETVVSNSIQEQPEKKKWQPVACADTKDKVFPLSFREYSFYLPYDFATRGTAYAEKKGSKGVFWDKEATQATRSSGKNAKEYTYMYATEDPSSCSVDLKNGIRPAIWIDSLGYNKGKDPYNQTLRIDELIKQGKYKEAVELSDSLGTYYDSILRGFTIRVQAGNDAYERKNYKMAIDWYNDVKEYARDHFDSADASKKIIENDINPRMLECKYLAGVEAKNNGNPDEAITFLAEIGQYKDSMEMLRECFSQKHIPWSWLTRKADSTVNAGKDTGYTKTTAINGDDPHFGWHLGRFMLSGYTERIDNPERPVFIKTPGDNLILWFDLEQDINALNKDVSMTINRDTNGYDQQFQIPKSDFGRGALFVRHIDAQNADTDPQQYRDYLAAHDDTGANTKVEIKEEGIYEVALDYEISKKSKITVVDKVDYYDYRISFSFEIRNGSGMFFMFDPISGGELQDYSVVKNGFRIDLANSHALRINYTRYAVNQSGSGLDVRKTSTASDGDLFEAVGYYEITATNKETNESLTKHVFVGDENDLESYKNANPEVMARF